MPAAPGQPATNASGAKNANTVPSSVLTPRVPTGDLAGLGRAIETWRSQPGDLLGAKRLADKPVRAGYSWLVTLLPHLGHQDVYDRFDLTKGWHEKENLQTTAIVIPAFLDPANPEHRWKGYPFVGDGPALTHFVGMSGLEDSRNMVAAELPRSDPRAGIFGYEQVARTSDITDGAAQTIMIIGSGRVTAPWIQGGGATIRGARAPYFDSLTGFGSAASPGSGATVLLADGSVRQISKDIDPAVFRAMCTIHGAETIDTAKFNAAVQPKP